MNEQPQSRFVVVIPAYNEEATIADIVQRALKHTDFVIVVNDGSSDRTSQTLSALPVVVLDNSTNLGKGKSLCAGARYALKHGVEVVITMDGDGQHRPEDIPLLLEKAALHPNKIIIAARIHNRHVAPLSRRFANRFADFWISWAAGQRIRDSQSGYRLYPAAAFLSCATDSGGFVFESEVLIDAARRGLFTEYVAISTLYGEQARASHYRPIVDTSLIVRMVAWKLIRWGLYPLGLLRSLGLLPRSHVAGH